jgi:hypothetical protein
MVFEELRRRRRVLRERYPFSQVPGLVTLVPKRQALTYIFLLCIAKSENFRAERRYAEVDEPCDEVVREALKGYLGAPGTRGLRFGHPASGDRPSDFPEAVAWLAERLCLPLGSGTPRAASNDGGVDVGVWKPFADRGTAFVTILAQCTVRLEWRDKARDIVPAIWCTWIDFGPPLITCLAIPFVLPRQYPWWEELRHTVGLLLERVRIVEHISYLPAKLTKRVAEWTSGELQRMGAPHLKHLAHVVRRRHTSRMDVHHGATASEIRVTAPDHPLP